MAQSSERAPMDDVVARVVKSYRRSGELAFSYGQGSVLSGLVADSDLDIVMIWAGDIPPRSRRPARAIASDSPEPVQHDGAFGGIDSFHVDGWPVDVAHHTKREFDRWVAEVLGGDGWRVRTEWPSPLFAVSGFAYGELLADERGLAGEARQRLGAFPRPLADTTFERLDQLGPPVLSELAGCARRGDGWLFHDLVSDLVRTAYLAWFAAHRRYCPFPKRVGTWALRLGLDPELVEREQRIWMAATLDERLARVTAFVEGVQELSPYDAGGVAPLT